MNAAPHALTRSGQEWPIGDDDPFISPHRLPGGAIPGQVSRFGAARWDLTVLSTDAHQSAVSLAWDPFPPAVRPSFRRAGWALVNLPTPEELLERAWTMRVKWISPATMRSVVSHWRRFADWLTDRGISRLADVGEDDLEEYAGHVAGLKRRRQKTAEILASISLLWAFTPHLPSGDRIPMPPWESQGLRDYLPADEQGNENTTPPIHPAVMSPLLVWALRFVEDFADDILAAWEEREHLVGQIPEHPDPQAARRLRALIEEHIAGNRPLPGGFYLGQLFAARTYLAAMTSATEQQAKVALRDYGRGLPVSSETPLRTTIRGQLHGRPWKTHINFNEAPILMLRLATAAMILVIYLSGMRPGEALNLRVGCCPEPADDGDSSLRHEIRGNFYKGARDDGGKIVPGGLPRQTPWTVILPVVHAIRLLERMAEGYLLFPVKTAWAKATRGNRTRPGEALHCRGAMHRINAFTAWVNDFASQQGLSAERIPDDPEGPIVLKRFRRTVAWHIARLPAGRVALATQYGHLRTSTVTDGYSGRARQGLRRVLDIETARAMADYLGGIADRVEQGEGVSGPAANRMIKAARDAAVRYEGMFLTPRQAATLLAQPQFNVYDNPEAFLTCNNDPAKAMCHPERIRGSRRDLPPAIDRCDPACTNIARTDTHIRKLREEIIQLNEEITSPLTPIPLRERLKQRIYTLQAIAERHDRTRIISARGASDDR